MSTSRCRVCSTDVDCARNIFTGRCSNGQSYAEALTSLVDGITVAENDSMPSYICEACVSRLESSIACGIIVDGFASKYLSFERPSTGAGIETKPEFEESLQVRLTETNSDSTVDVKTEEICLKTESDDEYFRTDFDADGADPLETKPSECDSSYDKSANDGLDSEKRSFVAGKPHECDRCGKAFSRKNRLEVHVRTHTGEKPHECDRCEKAFATKQQLTRHLRMHAGEKQYECDRCEKAFSWKPDLIRHSWVHADVTPYKCDICGNKFHEKYKFLKHSRTHTGEKPYECDSCGKAFAEKSDLKRHSQTHAAKKPYDCDVCGNSFSRRNYLDLHRRTHAERQHECDRCGKVLGGKRELTRHLRTHTGENPYECDRCEKKFSEKYKLTRHLRTHADKKSCRCDVCGTAFDCKIKLTRHLRTHAGEEPSECDRCCGTGFVERSDRPEHVDESHRSNSFTDRRYASVATVDIEPEGIFLKVEPVDESF